MKEEIFIQTGRREEIGSWGGEDLGQGDRPGQAEAGIPGSPTFTCG